jgi:hypothetical protein
MNEYTQLAKLIRLHRRTLAVWGCLATIVFALAGCGGQSGQTAPTTAATAPPVAAATAAPTSTLPAVTAQPIASPPPTGEAPTPQSTGCELAVQPALADTWNRLGLGCPTTPGAAGINTAYAPFEGGLMLWRGDTDTIYVLTGDGRYTSYPNAWREGDPEFSCGEADPLVTPVRGFGRVWCDNPAVQQALGAVTAAEIGDNASVVQEFEVGMVLTAPFGDLFVFNEVDGAWRQIDASP